MTDAPQPWFASEAGGAGKRHAPAALRNRDAIAAVLRDILPERGVVLELASGSGEHIVHFAGLFPALEWQPSDPDSDALASIATWSGESGLPNIGAPLAINVQADDWSIDHADAMLCINMVHISPWEATIGLMRGAARLLATNAPLYLYGPYIRPDVETSPSNLVFDQSLRNRNRAWGLRQVDDMIDLARENGIIFCNLVEMPANNISLIFKRSSG